MKNRKISNGWLCKIFLARTCPTENVSNCRIFPFFPKQVSSAAQCKHKHNSLLFASLAFVRILFQMDLACCLTVNCNAIAPQRTMQFSSSICTLITSFGLIERLLCKKLQHFPMCQSIWLVLRNHFKVWDRQREKHCKLLETQIGKRYWW